MAAGSIREITPYVVNFVLVVGGLGFIFRKQIAGLFFQRHERVKDFVENSSRAHEASVERNRTVTERIEKIQKEIDELLAGEVGAAQAERSRILAQCEIDLAQIVKDTDRIMINELEDLEKKLRSEFLDDVLASAENRLKSELKSDDHKKIVQEAQSRIEVGV